MYDLCSPSKRASQFKRQHFPVPLTASLIVLGANCELNKTTNIGNDNCLMILGNLIGGCNSAGKSFHVICVNQKKHIIDLNIVSKLFVTQLGK